MRSFLKLGQWLVLLSGLFAATSAYALPPNRVAGKHFKITGDNGKSIYLQITCSGRCIARVSRPGNIEVGGRTYVYRRGATILRFTGNGSALWYRTTLDEDNRRVRDTLTAAAMVTDDANRLQVVSTGDVSPVIDAEKEKPPRKKKKPKRGGDYTRFGFRGRAVPVSGIPQAQEFYAVTTFSGSGTKGSRGSISFANHYVPVPGAPPDGELSFSATLSKPYLYRPKSARYAFGGSFTVTSSSDPTPHCRRGTRGQFAFIVYKSGERHLRISTQCLERDGGTLVFKSTTSGNALNYSLRK